jgi:hypothetical protein
LTEEIGIQHEIPHYRHPQTGKLLKEAGVGRHDYFFALNFLFSPSMRSRVML